MVCHSQTDSQIKRINQEVKAFLQHYANYQQGNWTEWISAVEFQYNNKKHLATEYMPFKLDFGRQRDLTIETKLLKLETFLKELQRSWKLAKLSMKKAKKNYEETV